MALTETLDIPARDGYALGATLYRPAKPNGRAVQIHAATGVKQDYYARFAAYLAGRGFTVLTFDYRGIGRSLRSSLRKLRARMRDWAELDAAGALDFLEKNFSHTRILAVGHSFGGQAFGLVPGHERLAGALAVGAQSGYWRNWPLKGRVWTWPTTHLLLPALPRLIGYFPSSKLGFGEDLPAGVAIEWASWCRHPRYLVGAVGAEDSYARFAAPLRAYALSDDAFAPPFAVRAMLELYPASRTELRQVSPREVGAPAIGHFGFFRERFRDNLWRDAALWLEAQ